MSDGKSDVAAGMDLHFLLCELDELKTKYMELGIFLKISKDKIDGFEKDYPNNSYRVFIEVLNFWLKNCDGDKESCLYEALCQLGCSNLKSKILEKCHNKGIHQAEQNLNGMETAPLSKKDIDGECTWTGAQKRKINAEGDVTTHELEEKVIQHGDRPSLIMLVNKYGYNVSKKQNENGETLLHLACKSGHLDIVQMLVEIYACSLMETDKFGNSSYHTACANGQFRVIYYFICKYQFNCGLRNHHGNNLLHLACESGSLETTKLVILDSVSAMQHVKLNDIYDDILSVLYYKNDFKVLPRKLESLLTENDEGLTPLHVACTQNFIHILKFFFCEVCVVMNINLTPFMPSLLLIAYKQKYTDLILYLWCHSQRMQHQVANVGDANILAVSAKKSNRLQLEPPLYFAAKSGDLDFFNKLIQYDEIANSCWNSSGCNLLHAASISGNIAMVKLVSSIHREFINSTNNDGSNCLHLACEWGYLPIAKYFISGGLSKNSTNNYKDTPLHLSVRHNRKDIFNYLLSLNVDICSENMWGDTPLHVAASDSHLLEYAKCLLSQSDIDSINRCNLDGDTPLFCACRTRSSDMIKLFTDHPNCEILYINDKKKETIANIACRFQWYNLLKDLLKSRYPERLQNYIGRTLLHQACLCDDADMVKFLAFSDNGYKASEDINLNDDLFKITPLHLAAKRKHISLFKCLLEIPGCDPDAKDKVGDTVLHMCCKINHGDMAALCIDKCSKTIRNDLGNTPLHEACFAKNYEMLKWLLKQLPPDSRVDSFINKDGYSLLHAAALQEDAASVLKEIIERGVCDFQSVHEPSGDTALHLACHAGLLENSIFLVQLNYDIDSCWYNKRGESPLLKAFLNQKYDLLKACVPLCSDKLLANFGKFTTNPDSTLYSNSLQEFRIPLAHYLLLRLKDTPHSETGHQTAVQLQRYVFDLVVHFLMSGDNGKPLNPFYPLNKLIDLYGNTPLHVLARCNHLPFEGFDKLVDKFIEDIGVNHLNKNGAAPLHCACFKHQDWIIMKILNAPNGLLYLNDSSTLKYPSDYFSSPDTTFRFLLALGARDKFDTKHFHFGAKFEPNSIQVLTLGNSSVGKSTLIASLKRMITKERSQCYPKGSTTGVVRSEFLYYRNSNQQICFYDFAGQVEFETSHSIYLENLLSSACDNSCHIPFVFFLVVSATETLDNNKAQIDKWIAFIHSHIKHDKTLLLNFIVVCTHEDCLSEDIKSTCQSELENYMKSDKIPYFVSCHEKLFFLNGLKTDTVPLNSLLHHLDDIFISCEKIVKSKRLEELNEFLNKFFSTTPCQIKDLIAKIKECRKFKLDSKFKIVCEGSHPDMAIPEVPGPLADLLVRLQTRNHIMLLRQSKDKLDWWIVSKSVQNDLFSHANSLFSPSSFEDAPVYLSSTHNTGVVPVEKLQDLLSSTGIDWKVMLAYLDSMEYCKKLPSDMYDQIFEDTSKAMASTDLYFFPGLINSDRDDTIYASIDSDTSKYYFFGWMMKSKARFGLRFLHCIILQLMFTFAHCTTPNLPFQRSIYQWKNGLFWLTQDQIEVLVEIRNEVDLVMLCRCVNAFMKPGEFVKYRSAVLRKIRIIKEKLIFSGTDIRECTEFYLYPPPTSYASLDNCSQISLDEMATCFKDPLRKRTVKLKDPFKVIHLNDILLFEPYVFMEACDLMKLESEESLSKSMLRTEIITNISEVAELVDTISYLDLCSILDNYSIFERRHLKIKK